MRYCFTILFFTLCLVAAAQGTSTDGFPKNGEKIKVFPNPATTTITVLGLKNTDKAMILIFDSTGTALQQHQWEIRNNAINMTVASLESGMYSISISSKEQQVLTRFYKQ